MVRCCSGTFAAVLWTLPPFAVGTAFICIVTFVEVDNTFGIP
jgi:hypothetical protein